ncbi:GmrSD restriction endonuclease domain-containing protein [Onishia taeanensis]
MSTIGQSSKAHDRSLGEWFHDIQRGSIKLPRFQRMEAWDRNRIASFLDTVISNLPMGVVLILQVDGNENEKFVSRHISTAEPEKEGTVTQHLLDGQQRLTAFWRAMYNNYDYETFFVYHPEFDPRAEKSGEEVQVFMKPRWYDKHGRRMPLWADDPKSTLERGLFPISLLRPGDMSAEISTWLADATQHLKPAGGDEDAFEKLQTYMTLQEKLKDAINQLRERVTHFNLPYLALPAATPKEVALQVFINMNTNSKPLSLYDIIVAEVESVAGSSLHDLEARLDSHCPYAKRYAELRDLILSTSALLQDKVPNNRGMIEMNKQVLVDNWHHLERGLERMAAFLASQGIHDAARLPTNAVLPVVAACYELIPDDGDYRGKAEILLQRYLWSAFFTDRYENSSSSRAYADFKALKLVLQNQQFDESHIAQIPVMDRPQYPLATKDELKAAGWPKGMGIEARGIMAVTTYLEARDFADNQPASYDSLQKREYHHVFPDALLQEAEILSFLALNCALITWKTNRVIGRKDPLAYLKERVDWAGESTVRQRMKTHLIDYDLLAKGDYGDLQQPQARERLKQDFERFLDDRAGRVAQVVECLAAGQQPDLHQLWQAPATMES